MIVIDASALIAALLPAANTAAVRARLSVANGLHAPHLIDVETVQVIRRFADVGNVDADRARMAVHHVATFPLRRHRHQALFGRVWDLRGNLTAYDALYVALAESLDAPLLTCDRRIAAAPGHRARIELI